MAGDPDVMIAGLPERTRDGAGFDEIIDAAIFETFEGLPAASGAIRTSCRTPSSGASAPPSAPVWGKKPQVHALVVEV